MSAQSDAAFGAALTNALAEREMTQAELAALMEVASSQVSRWMRGVNRPSAKYSTQLHNIFGDALRVPIAPPRSEKLYVASPITGLAGDLIEHHHRVAAVVHAARQVLDDVYWPGEAVSSLKDLRSAGVATEENMIQLAEARGLLYVQFAEVSHATGALVELGIALGSTKRTTIILGPNLQIPFMFSQGFEGVAERIEFLPDAHIHRDTSADQAVNRIRATGSSFFGIKRVQTVHNVSSPGLFEPTDD